MRSLHDATQVAGPFHLVKLANAKVDEARRVQNETLAAHPGMRSGRGCSTRCPVHPDVTLGVTINEHRRGNLQLEIRADASRPAGSGSARRPAAWLTERAWIGPASTSCSAHGSVRGDGRRRSRVSGTRDGVAVVHTATALRSVQLVISRTARRTWRSVSKPTRSTCSSKRSTGVVPSWLTATA